MSDFAPAAVRSATVLQGGYLRRPAYVEQRHVGGRVFMKALASDTQSVLGNFLLKKNEIQALAEKRGKHFRPCRLVCTWEFWIHLRRLRNKATQEAAEKALDDAADDKPKIDLNLDAPAKRRRVQLPLDKRPETVSVSITWHGEVLKVLTLSGLRQEPLWLEFQPKTMDFLFKAFRQDFVSNTGFGQGDPVDEDEDEQEEGEEQEEEEEEQ